MVPSFLDWQISPTFLYLFSIFQYFVNILFSKYKNVFNQHSSFKNQKKTKLDTV